MVTSTGNHNVPWEGPSHTQTPQCNHPEVAFVRFTNANCCIPAKLGQFSLGQPILPPLLQPYKEILAEHSPGIEAEATDITNERYCVLLGCACCCCIMCIPGCIGNEDKYQRAMALKLQPLQAALSEQAEKLEVGHNNMPPPVITESQSRMCLAPGRFI